MSNNSTENKDLEGPSKWPDPTITEAQAAKILDDIMVELLRFRPFYGFMLTEVDKRIDMKVKGAYVARMSNRIQLVIGGAVFENCTRNEVTGVLIHELMHCMLDFWSRLGTRDVKLFNIAQDLVINEMIVADHAQYKTPKWTLFMDEFNKRHGTSLTPTMSSEDVYDILYKKAQKNSGGEGGKSGKGGKGNDQDGGETIEDPDNMQGQGMDEAEGDIVREALRYVVRKAASKAQGNIPESLRSIVDEWLQPPQIPWQRQLMYYTGQARKGLYNLRWRKPNRRYGEAQRGKTPGRALGLGCVFDTSGSMSDEEVAADIAELQGIQKAVKTHVMIAHADAEVQRVFELRKHDRVKFERHGCGGTDFRPAIARFEGDPKIDVIIYFTDLMGNFPDHAPKKPVLWVTTGDATAPYGRTIRKENKHEKR